VNRQLLNSYDEEVNLASKVQQMLLPKSSPLCDWCCMGVKNHMAEGLGGDYFDFISIPDNRQAVVLGDVTGHGLHASVIMSLLLGFIHRSSANICTPLDMVLQVNHFLNFFGKRSLKFDHLFSSTLFFAVIDPQTLEMQYVNAGHCSPMVLRQDRIIYLSPTGPPVGFFNEPEIEQQSFRLQKGDRMLIHTDGIIEAFSPQGDLFGRSRLEKVLLAGSADYLEFLDQIFEELRMFMHSPYPDDDCTAIVMDFH